MPKENSKSSTSSLLTLQEIIENLGRDKEKVEQLLKGYIIQQKQNLLIAKANLKISPFEFYLDFLKLKLEDKVIYFGANYLRKTPERKFEIGKKYAIKEFTPRQKSPVISPETGDIILTISENSEAPRITTYKNFVPDLDKYAHLLS